MLLGMVKPRPHSRTKPPRTPNTLRFVKASELAHLLGVSAWTVYSWTRSRKIPALRASDRILRFNIDAVLAALEGGRA
jgi:excisionase family DNA binding protein